MTDGVRREYIKKVQVKFNLTLMKLNLLKIKNKIFNLRT